MAKKSNLMLPIVIILSIAAGAVGYKLLTAPDERTTEDKLNDALDEIKKGADKAARELEDRTTIDKFKDASQDIMDDMKKSTDSK